MLPFRGLGCDGDQRYRAGAAAHAAQAAYQSVHSWGCDMILAGQMVQAGMNLKTLARVVKEDPPVLAEGQHRMRNVRWPDAREVESPA
jgi:hypothetical protein